MVISYLNVALEIFRLSETLLVYYYKCCNLIGYANRYVFVNRYRVAATYCKAEFFVKQQWLFLVFQNNFEEITYVSLFLLKQLDYSLSISIKRQLTLVSPQLTITPSTFRARNLILNQVLCKRIERFTDFQKIKNIFETIQ